MKASESKIRGLIFSTVYYPFASGAEIAVKEIADRLPEYEWDLITARMDPTLPRVDEIGRITIHRVGVGHPTWDKFLLPLTGFLKARMLYKRRMHALVWSMMASQASIPAAFMKIWYSRLRLVLTLQEGDEEEYLKRYVGGNEFLYKVFVRPWHLLVFRKADCITVISEHLGRRAAGNNTRVPIEVVPNGVDFSVFKKVQPPTSGPTVLSTTSRLVEKNDPESVIRALPLLPSSVHFWILGHGVQEQDLKDLVKELGVESRVFFLGNVDHRTMAEMFQKAHIFIRPSLSEGLGSSFLEAMGVGLPIIATPVGGIPDFLKDGDTGLFCRVKDPESIADAVRRLLDDPALYKHISETGYAFARERYDWMRVARAMASRAFDTALTRRTVLIAAALYPPDPGGPATHAHRVVEGLPKLGVETRLVRFGDVRHLPPGIRHVWYFAKLLIAARGVDVVYAYDAVSSGFAAACTALLMRKRFIVRIGGDRLWERAFENGETTDSLAHFYAAGAHKKTRLFSLIQWVLRRADLLIVPSEMTARLYADHYGVPTARISIVPNPVVGTREDVPHSLPPMLLFASRLVKYKNLRFVFHSLAHLVQEGMRFSFVVLGDGPERASLDALRKELHLETVITMRGAVSRDEAVALARRSYLSLAPALTEFHPNYVMDGISYSKPFLISQGNALPFEVPEMFLFDPEDHEQFEEKLRFLLSKDGYEAARAALSSIQFSFSWDDVLKETSDLVRNICAY